jgi:hypothetical protein
MLTEPDQYKKFIKHYLMLTYMVMILQFSIYGIPFAQMLNNTLGSGYLEYGNALLNAFQICSCKVIFTFSIYCSISQKKQSLFWIFISILSLMPSLLCVQRGIFMEQLFQGLCIIVLLVKINFKRIAIMCLAISTILFVFGFLGNMRTGNSDDFAVKLWQANKKFEDTKIPKTYFFGYIYMTSPLACLQNTINNKEITEERYNIDNFVITCILPRHIYGIRHLPGQVSIHPSLNVFTGFIDSYLSMGYLGMYLLFLYLMLFIYVILHLIRVDSPFKIPLIACLCEMTVIFTFDNTVRSMGILPQIAIYFVLSYYFTAPKKIALK